MVLRRYSFMSLKYHSQSFWDDSEIAWAAQCLEENILFTKMQLPSQIKKDLDCVHCKDESLGHKKHL